MNIIEQLDREQIARLGKQIPDFQPGDTVQVNVKVVEGERTRVQAYEGVCIGRSGGGLNESFTVRKISYGEGVERVFPIHSPMIDSIKVVRRGKVRRAKLYYLRGRRGKAARISERQDHRSTGDASRPVSPSAARAPPRPPRRKRRPPPSRRDILRKIKGRLARPFSLRDGVSLALEAEIAPGRADADRVAGDHVDQGH